MANIEQITQRRIDGRIEFTNYRGEAVACLIDGQDHIIHDPWANSVALFLDEVPSQDYPAIFKKIGLDVMAARLIDAMPSHDTQAV